MVFMEINLNIVWRCESSIEVANRAVSLIQNRKEEQKQVTFGYTCLEGESILILTCLFTNKTLDQRPSL